MSRKRTEPVMTLTKKDFIIQTFRAGGKGGQKQNKTDSGVRIIHPDSGARGESREERSQHQNRAIAFKRLTETNEFKRWLRLRHSEILSGKTIDQIVDEQMAPNNLHIEVKDDSGKWVDIDSDS